MFMQLLANTANGTAKISAVEWVLGILLLSMAAFLVVAVLLQSGKDKKLSGTITGGSGDTYFGKNKGKSFDRILSRLTIIISTVFCVLVVAMYVIVSGLYQ